MPQADQREAEQAGEISAPWLIFIFNLNLNKKPMNAGARAMPTMQQISEFGRRIGEEFKPRQVVLFGSYARGETTADSDVDVLVVMPFEGRAADKSVEIRLKLKPSFPLDLLVRTPEAVRRRIEIGDTFMRDVLQHGKVLYEAPDC